MASPPRGQGKPDRRMFRNCHNPAKTGSNDTGTPTNHTASSKFEIAA
jgi:hypothetical protein